MFVWVAQRDSYCNLVGMYETTAMQHQQQQQSVSLTSSPRVALASSSSTKYSRVRFGIKQFDMVSSLILCKTIKGSFSTNKMSIINLHNIALQIYWFYIALKVKLKKDRRSLCILMKNSFYLLIFVFFTHTSNIKFRIRLISVNWKTGYEFFNIDIGFYEQKCVI